MKKLLLIFISLTVAPAAHGNLKKALIFGVTGQDGYYLTEFLLEHGDYEVHGVCRRASTNKSRLDHLSEKTSYKNKFFLHQDDLTDAASVAALVQQIDPDEIYNLAAQSHVALSFNMPEQTGDIDGLGVLRILEAIRKTDKTKKTKFYQASTSEMFGKVTTIPQNEKTPFNPRSPYAISKLYGYWVTVNYREAYGMFACNGILFNHESPLRGENFVTRKITKAVAKMYMGTQDVLYLGNLDVRRDWGYAKDYVIAMWQMLQQEKPGDYVIATGQAHAVREFVELAFKEIGYIVAWEGEGVDEYGYDLASGKVLVRIDPQFYRPTEVDFTLGNASKARHLLDWKPTTSFEELVKIMVREDIKNEFKTTKHTKE